MKLFSSTDQFEQKLSLEEFVQQYQSSKVISTESISDFLSKSKDLFQTTFKRLTEPRENKIIIDTMSTKHQTINNLKQLKFIDIKDYIVSKPENFRGKYVDYALDLINSSEIILEDTEKTLANLKLAIAAFINEYSDNKAIMLYGATYFKKTENLIKQHQNEIQQYFKDQNHTTKAAIGDVLKTLNDIEVLYTSINKLDGILNLGRINYIVKLTKETEELIDVLIKTASANKVFEHNTKAKEDLIQAVYISARSVEFTSYLYGNAIYLYGAFKSLTERLNELSKVNA